MDAKRFVSRGSFVAVPLCFPNVTVPIPPDESFIAAVAFQQQSSSIYGVTSGTASHMFCASLKPPGGYVFDMGSVPDAAQAVAVVLTKDSVIGAFNSASSGRIVSQHLVDQEEGIQEWGFRRQDYQSVVELPDERILDAVISGSNRELICLTDKRLVRVTLEDKTLLEIKNGKIQDPALSRIGRTNDGSLFVTHNRSEIGQVNTDKNSLEETGLSLPFDSQGFGWTPTPCDRLVAADNGGTVITLDPSRRQIETLCQVPVPPVKCMAALPDGRVYGFCGEGIGRFFVLDLNAGSSTDLGAVAAVLGVKRYAYNLGCCAAGSDGELYFGEDDRGGHLWTYFPPQSLISR